MNSTLKVKTKSSIELEIIDLFNKGDIRSLTLIKRHYFANLYGISYNIVQDDTLAKDAVQESLIKVWKNYKRFDDSKATLFTWLYRIVKNTSLDIYRSRSIKRKRELRNELTLVDNFKSTSINIDTLDVIDNLNKLDLKYRIVIYLKFINGMSVEQIAERLDTPLGTVKSRVRIGLRELRKIYLN